MSNLIKIFVFRHGETDWNRERRWQGQTDVPLNERGRNQAVSLAKYSERWNLEAVYSSDLVRASETARIISSYLKIPLELDHDLREGNFGHAEGLTKDEILKKYGQDFVRRWKSLEAKHLDLSFPEGESRRQILGRFLRSIDRIISTSSWRVIGISTHGSILKHFIQHVEPTFDVPTPIPNCAAFAIEYHKDTGTFRMANGNALEITCSSHDSADHARPT